MKSRKICTQEQAQYFRRLNVSFYAQIDVELTVDEEEDGVDTEEH